MSFVHQIQNTINKKIIFVFLLFCMGEDKNDFTSGFVGTLAFLTKCNQSVNKFLKIDLHYFISKMLYKPLLLIYALHDLVKELIDYELRTQKRHFR